LEIREALLGPDHPVLAGLLLDYARMLRLAHRKSEAARLAARGEVLARKDRRGKLGGGTVEARAVCRPAASSCGAAAPPPPGRPPLGRSRPPGRLRGLPKGDGQRPAGCRPRPGGAAPEIIMVLKRCPMSG